MGMPLKATENAALAMTPAASTFHRWRGGRGEAKGLGLALRPAGEEVMAGSMVSPNHPENHIISYLQSSFSAR
mgnify:CR=1 FL=1